MSHFVLPMNVAFYVRHQCQAFVILHSSVSFSDCSFHIGRSRYGGVANIEFSNATVCGHVVIQNNICNHGGATFVNKSL